MKVRLDKKKFKALNDFIHIEPMEEEQKKGKAIEANVKKERKAIGKVLSVGEGRHLADGTLVKPVVKPGELIAYNPHLVGYELKDSEGKITLIISNQSVYGKYE